MQQHHPACLNAKQHASNPSLRQIASHPVAPPYRPPNSWRNTYMFLDTITYKSYSKITYKSSGTGSCNPLTRKEGKMATPQEKLARSLEALKTLQDKGVVAIQARDLSRAHREHLLRNGFIQEVMKGWYIPARPGERGRQLRMVCIVLGILRRIFAYALPERLVPLPGAIPVPARWQPRRPPPVAGQNAEGRQQADRAIARHVHLRHAAEHAARAGCHRAPAP